jgi:hypothetical protein
VFVGLGILSTFEFGEFAVQVGFGWLFFAVIGDLLLRKKDPQFRAKGRLVASSIALLMALNIGFTHFREEQKTSAIRKDLIEHFMAATVDADRAPGISPSTTLAQGTESPSVGLSEGQPTGTVPGHLDAYLNAGKKRAKDFAEESAAINRKFSSIDLSGVLLPKNLTNKASIDASRRTLNSYKAVIAERDATLVNHFALTEKITRSSNLTEKEVREGLAGLESGKALAVKNYGDLTRVQLATVAASEAILDFAEQNLGHMGVKNGQPLFETQPQLDEYRRLVGILNVAVSNESVVSKKVEGDARKLRQSMADSIK